MMRNEECAVRRAEGRLPQSEELTVENAPWRGEGLGGVWFPDVSASKCSAIAEGLRCAVALL